MTDKARQEAIDSFQNDPSVRVMIANPAAGGVGVTLTAASYMIYYSRDFSLENDLQSEARCHRGGSEAHEKITRIDIVAPGTIDEVILEALERKENLATKILAIREKL
jgi:SNF2 family DNA or RNA helicase